MKKAIFTILAAVIMSAGLVSCSTAKFMMKNCVTKTAKDANNDSWHECEKP